MTAYFNKTGWPEKAPSTDSERKIFIASLHKRKTELFMALIEKKLLPLRSGVARYNKYIIGMNEWMILILDRSYQILLSPTFYHQNIIA